EPDRRLRRVEVRTGGRNGAFKRGQVGEIGTDDDGFFLGPQVVHAEFEKAKGLEITIAGIRANLGPIYRESTMTSHVCLLRIGQRHGGLLLVIGYGNCATAIWE